VLVPVPGVDRLSLLPAGPVPPNPAELLNSASAQKIFARLRDEFDLVLIDSPPVLPVTDAAILSQHADATLMLAAAGQTRRGDLHRAVEKLDQVGATILGVVLNKVTKHTGRNYGYGYSYTYKPDQYSYKPNHPGTASMTQSEHLNGSSKAQDRSSN
jgi:capsular exopolysaccharide synthesis family protein